MARIFDANTSNFLSAATTFASGRNPCTVGAWYKVPDAAQVGLVFSLKGTTDRMDAAIWYTSSSSNYMETQNTGGGVANSNQTGPGNVLVPDVWQLVVLVIDGTDSHLYIDGTEYGGNTGSYVGLSTNLTDLYLGIYQGTAAALDGSIAHAFGFARALSGAEITSLLTNDPSTLSSTSREFYYPLVTAALTNDFTPVSGDSIGTLTENGTVAWDTDSPYSGTDIDVDIDVAGAVSIAGQSIGAAIDIAVDTGTMSIQGQTITTSFGEIINVDIDAGTISIEGQIFSTFINSSGGDTDRGRDGRRRGRSISLFGRG